jgi:hypothetical protein
MILFSLNSAIFLSVVFLIVGLIIGIFIGKGFILFPERKKALRESIGYSPEGAEMLDEEAWGANKMYDYLKNKIIKHFIYF